MDDDAQTQTKNKKRTVVLREEIAEGGVGVERHEPPSACSLVSQSHR